MVDARCAPLCSTWIRVSARPMAIRKAAPTTATSLAPATTRCSCSTSSATSKGARCVRATFTRQTAGGVLEPVVARYRGSDVRHYFRADAAFANPEVYEFLEAEGCEHTIRLPANRILQDRIGYLLKRPVGRPPLTVRRSYASFSYQAASWTMPRRVVAKVEWHPWRTPSPRRLHRHQPVAMVERAVAFYSKRGTCEQWIKEGKNAIKWTRLSCWSFTANAVRLQLHALAYNLANFMRTLVRDGRAVVADQPAREADQNRCQGRAPHPLRRLPDG